MERLDGVICYYNTTTAFLKPLSSASHLKLEIMAAIGKFVPGRTVFLLCDMQERFSTAYCLLFISRTLTQDSRRDGHTCLRFTTADACQDDQSCKGLSII